ncbi:MAG: DUF3800 domain-containing protein, partial [Polyangiaceae bacterium]
LSYFDESGDTGFTDSPSTCFVLAGVLVDEGDWLGHARIEQVNEITRARGGPPPPHGIVVWPA